jgi:hypothetical protein
LQSQGAIALKDGETDCGVLDKIIDIRPPFQFVAESKFDESNPRQRKSDKKLLNQVDANELAGELLFHASCWYRTLNDTICQNRNIEPRPPSCVQHADEAHEAGDFDRIQIWMTKSLKYCTEAEAAPVKEVHAAMKVVFGKVEPSMRTAAGLYKIGQHRKGSKAHHHDFYRVLLPGDVGEQRPVKLKEKEDA